MNYFSYFFLLLYICIGSYNTIIAQNVITGAERTDKYISLLEGKKVGLVVNHTSIITSPYGEKVSLPDSLLRRGIDLRCIMAPEHGYKGIADAGEHVANGTDSETGLRIYSLYGNDKKPRKEWLTDIDIIVFDMQDVGTRFYTYLSTLKYVIEACGEEEKEFVLLDRPNPNDVVDGPILDMNFSSFVGVLPIPILHGCTFGELTRMMIAEEWVKYEGDYYIIPCKNWQHGQKYVCPIAPSPNLSNQHAIKLYPSLCLFEGTSVSVGRGTSTPFELYGEPNMKSKFSFVPRPSASNKNPLQNGKTCFGKDLRNVEPYNGFSLEYLIDAYAQLGDKMITSVSFFDRLAGSDKLRKQITSGMKEADIIDSWQTDLNRYKSIRTKYLIYK